MDSSASSRTLGEAALLYLILSQLSQQDLLRVQRVCQSWYRFISSDPRLLTMMWLNPGYPSADQATTRINPLLRRVFSNLFDPGQFWNAFTTLPDVVSPFTNMWGRETGVREALTYPNASWRRMITVLSSTRSITCPYFWRSARQIVAAEIQPNPF